MVTKNIKKTRESLTPDLGDLVKDSVTGYRGIVVARTEWLNGCYRLTMQSDTLDKDGKPQPTETFDEPQLILIEKGVVHCGSRDTGGPKPTPTQHSNPTR